MSLYSFLTVLYLDVLTKCEKWSQGISVLSFYLLPTSCVYDKVDAACVVFFAKSTSPKIHQFASKDEIIKAKKILKTRETELFFYKLTTGEDILSVPFSMLLIKLKGYYYCVLFVFLAKLQVENYIYRYKRC